MNLKIAAEETKKLIQGENYSGKDGCNKQHIEWMLNQIIIGHITGEKGHRWLSWAQGVICVLDSPTLENMKQINFKAL